MVSRSSVDVFIFESPSIFIEAPCSNNFPRTPPPSYPHTLFSIPLCRVTARCRVTRVCPFSGAPWSRSRRSRCYRSARETLPTLGFQAIYGLIGRRSVRGAKWYRTCVCILKCARLWLRMCMDIETVCNKISGSRRSLLVAREKEVIVIDIMQRKERGIPLMWFGMVHGLLSLIVMGPIESYARWYNVPSRRVIVSFLRGGEDRIVYGAFVCLANCTPTCGEVGELFFGCAVRWAISWGTCTGWINKNYLNRYH